MKISQIVKYLEWETHTWWSIGLLYVCFIRRKTGWEIVYCKKF